MFCRFTPFGLLRLLTTPAVMGDEVMTQPQAWAPAFAAGQLTWSPSTEAYGRKPSQRSYCGLSPRRNRFSRIEVVNRRFERVAARNVRAPAAPAAGEEGASETTASRSAVKTGVNAMRTSAKQAMAYGIRLYRAG